MVSSSREGLKMVSSCLLIINVIDLCNICAFRNPSRKDGYSDSKYLQGQWMIHVCNMSYLALIYCPLTLSRFWNVEDAYCSETMDYTMRLKSSSVPHLTRSSMKTSTCDKMVRKKVPAVNFSNGCTNRPTTRNNELLLFFARYTESVWGRRF